MEWFKNLKIKVKLMSSYLMLCLLMLCVGVVGISGLNTMEKSINALYYDSLMGIANIKEIKSNVQYVRLLMQRVALPEYSDRIASLEKEIADSGALSNKCMEEYEAAMTDADDKQQFQELQKRLVTYRNARQELINMVKVGNYQEAHNLYDNIVVPANGAVIEQLDKMSLWNDNVGKTYIKNAEENYNFVIKLT